MEHVVIVGNGMVGHHLVAQLVERGAHLEKKITVIGEERFIAYDRVQLSSLFSGKKLPPCVVKLLSSSKISSFNL